MIELPATSREGFQVKLLGADDMPEVSLLLASQGDTMQRRRGYSINPFMGHLLRDMLSERVGFHGLLGAYLDGELYSTLGWRGMHAMNAWITTGLVVNGNLERNFFDPDQNGLCVLMHTYYMLAEQRGVLRHFSARHADKLGMEMKMWDRRTDIFLKRYLRQDEAFVRAGQLPEGVLYQHVMNFTAHPYDVIIRSVTLNPRDYDIRTGIDPYPYNPFGESP